MSTIPERIEIRVIGTDAQLKRAAAIISAVYDIHYQSDYYSCKDSKTLHRQYYKVTEREGGQNEQNHKADC